MNTTKLILKEAGLSGLNAKQVMILLYFCMSLFGCTMNDDAPTWAWLFVAANVIISGLLVKKYVKLNPKES